MRCPKCQYLSFDDGVRCRNCGFDFSLLESEAPLDSFPDRDIDRPTRVSDAPSDRGGPRPPGAGGGRELSMRALDEPAAAAVDLGLRPVRRGRDGAAAATPRALRRDLTPAGFDLPLFSDAQDDAPLISPSAVPRPPLVVRRAPATPRPRLDTYVPETSPLDFPHVDSLPTPQPTEAQPAAEVPADRLAAAAVGRRLLAAAIDLLVVGAVDAAVVYYTLQWCGLELGAFRALPVIPMLAFLLLHNGGYLTMFTAAGGQTIGKMIATIRVVPAGADDDHARVRLGTAIVRTGAVIVSLLPVGLGFFVALFRGNGRALHDAVAGTRVIRA